MDSLRAIILGVVLLLSLGMSAPVPAVQTDQTADVAIAIGRPYYDYAKLQTYTDIGLQNQSTRVLFAPVWLVIDSITTPQVTIDKPDGYTTDGKPYFNLTDKLGDQRFQPNESAGTRLRFNNPKQLRFNFTLKVLAETGPPNNPPSISYEGPVEIDEGQTLTAHVLATDPDPGDVVTLTATGLPPGARFDPAGGLLKWIPGFNQSGSYAPIFTATDSGNLSKSLPVDIKVREVNRPPLIQTQTLPPATIDQPYQVSIEATDPDGDTLHYGLLQSPPGMTLDPTQGRLSWLPQVNNVGSAKVDVRVDDGRGGVATRQWPLTVPDTVPPSVALNAPSQALPGASFTLSADATDNVAVSQVAIAVEGQSPVEFGAPPYTLPVQLPSVLAIGSTVGITVSATDAAGNLGQAKVTVQIVAAPDVTPPTATLNAPKQVTPGQTAILSAVVADNVGVATVTFYADGQPIGTVSGLDPVITYMVPADTPLDKPPVFTATVEDFSGQKTSVSAEVTPTVSQEPDQAPPQVTLDAPAAVEPGATLTIQAKTTDPESGVAKVEVYVDHVKVAVYWQPLDGEIQVPTPPELTPGATVLVELVVTDHAGNQFRQEESAAVQAAVLAGEVYDGQTGLPLAGATVSFIADGGGRFTTQTDPRGRYGLLVTVKPGRVTIEKTGYTQVERLGLDPPENGALAVFDARLTRVETQSTKVPAVLGGTLKAALSPVRAGLAPALQLKGIAATMPDGELTLTIPPGALATDTPLSLTPVGPQALQGLLPGGWSPLTAVDIQPHSVSLLAPAHLGASDLLGLAGGPGVILAAWDDEARVWRAIGPATLAADAFGAELTASGQYAFLVPDAVPQPPPPAEMGKPLTGVATPALADSITVTVSPDPRILFYQPGVRSEVGVTVTSAAPWPSGTQATTRLNEDYAFWAGTTLAPGVSRQDLVLYSMAGARLTAAYPVTPTREFEALSLKEGVITVDLFDRAAGGLGAVGNTGGTVTVPTGETLSIPPGALTELSPVELRRLAPTELAFPMPAHLHALGGVETILAGKALAAPAELRLPRPAEVNPSDTVLLLKLVDVQGTTRRLLVGLGRIEGQQLVSETQPPGRSDLRIEGLRDEGRYLFVKTDLPIGFAAGRVLDPAGGPLAGALVENAALGLAALSRTEGRYLSVGPVGPFTLTVLDPETGNTGTAQAEIFQAGGVVDLGIPLLTQQPQIVMTNPEEGAKNVGLTTGLLAQFSEALDPATVNADNVQLAGPGGAVDGTLHLGSGDTTVTFRPKQLLAPNTAYSLTLKPGIKDRAGQSLAAEYSLHFTSLDTLPPPPPPAGKISATIPAEDGKTTVTATQGTAGPHDKVTVLNRTQNLSEEAPVLSDGSFSAKVQAGLADEVVIVIQDTAGNETVVPVGAFHNLDGSVVVGPAGGEVEADNGVKLQVPAGAFPQGAVIRLQSLTEADFGVAPDPRFPFVAGFELNASVEPQINLDVAVPLPAGTSDNAKGILALAVQAFNQPALTIVDTAKVINGHLRTSSPPCPGTKQKLGRYAMFLNEHPDMAKGMEQVLLNILAPLIPQKYFYVVEYVRSMNYERIYPSDWVSYEVATSAGYRQDCLPAPPDRPLRVSIYGDQNGQLVEQVQLDPAAPNTVASVTLWDSSDKTPPNATSVGNAHHELGIGARSIRVRFSEKVNLPSGDSAPVSLTALDGGQETITGTVKLLEDGKLLEFTPSRPLPLDRRYQLNLGKIKDNGGHTFAGAPLVFSTFKPEIIFPSTGNYWVDMPPFANIDFTTRKPDETATGLFKTKLVAVKSETGRGYQLYIIDASDPSRPKLLGASDIDSRYALTKIVFLHDFFVQTRKPVIGWSDRKLYFRTVDPAIRFCTGSGSLSADFKAWRVRHCPPCLVRTAEFGGCGDLALILADRTKDGYLWGVDITDPATPRWISFRMLNDNGVGYGLPRHEEAPAGMGLLRGLDVASAMDIDHDGETHFATAGAYVANLDIGLELVDLGYNLPGINTVDRPAGSNDPARNEKLGLNSHLYYRDIAIVRAKVVAIAFDYRSGIIRSLEIFRPDLVGEPTGMARLPNSPNRLAAVTDFPIVDSGGTKLYDLAFVTGGDGGVAIVDIPQDGTNPTRIGFIKTPSGVVTNHIQIDPETRIAYVSASNIGSQQTEKGFLVIDISKPFMPAQDLDSDGWDDRVIGRFPLKLPDTSSPAVLNGFRFDAERGLIYAGVGEGQGLAIITAKQPRLYIEDYDPEFPDVKLNPMDYYPDLGIKTVRVRADNADGAPASGTVQVTVAAPPPGIEVFGVQRGENFAQLSDKGVAEFHLDAHTLTPAQGEIKLIFTWTDANGRTQTRDGQFRIRNNSITNLQEVLDGKAVFIAADPPKQDREYRGITEPVQVHTPFSDDTSPYAAGNAKARSHARPENQMVDFLQEMLNQVVPRNSAAMDQWMQQLKGAIMENGNYGEKTKQAVHFFKKFFNFDVNFASDIQQKLKKDYNLENQRWVANPLLYMNENDNTFDPDSIVDQYILIRDEIGKYEPDHRCFGQKIVIDSTSGERDSCEPKNAGLYEVYKNIVWIYIEAKIEAMESYVDNVKPQNAKKAWFSRPFLYNKYKDFRMKIPADPPIVGPCSTPECEAVQLRADLDDGRSGVAYSNGSRSLSNKLIEKLRNINPRQIKAGRLEESRFNFDKSVTSEEPPRINEVDPDYRGYSGYFMYPGLFSDPEICICKAKWPDDLSPCSRPQNDPRYWAGIDCSNFVNISEFYAKVFSTIAKYINPRNKPELFGNWLEQEYPDWNSLVPANILHCLTYRLDMSTHAQRCQNVAGYPLIPKIEQLIYFPVAEKGYTLVLLTPPEQKGIPPTIVYTYPGYMDTNVAPKTVITVQFSEPVNQETLKGKISLYSPNNEEIAGTVTYDQVLAAAVFRPSKPLTKDSMYYFDVKPGYKDSQGEEANSEYILEFKTASKDSGFSVPEKPTFRQQNLEEWNEMGWKTAHRGDLLVFSQNQLKSDSMNQWAIKKPGSHVATAYSDMRDVGKNDIDLIHAYGGPYFDGNGKKKFGRKVIIYNASIPGNGWRALSLLREILW